MAKLIVTSRGLETMRQSLRALRNALPDAEIHRASFRGVFVVEAEEDITELAKRVNQECFTDIGRVTAVLAEVQSTREEVERAAVEVGRDNIRRGEKFCFRLHKRGAHWLEQDTPELEREIGGAIWETLREKYGEEPEVDLEAPGVTITAEVLGPNTAVGILRKEWQVEVV